jgi:hypothetical protein
LTPEEVIGDLSKIELIADEVAGKAAGQTVKRMLEVGSSVSTRISLNLPESYIGCCG